VEASLWNNYTPGVLLCIGGARVDNSKIKTTDIGKLMVKIDADTKILIRRLEVIKSGIEFIIDGLTKIENGCPDCGNDKVIPSKIEFIDKKTKSVICSECGCEYLYRD
jgi:hypothetical protein